MHLHCIGPLRRNSTHLFEVPEWHKLDNVPGCWLTAGRLEHPIIPIQHPHVGEVGVSYADDDDGHRQEGGLDHRVSSLVDVGDHAVRQQQ